MTRFLDLNNWLDSRVDVARLSLRTTSYFCCFKLHLASRNYSYEDGGMLERPRHAISIQDTLAT